MLHRDNVLKELPIIVKAKNVLNVNQVFDEMQNVIDYIRKFLTDLETEK